MAQEQLNGSSGWVACNVCFKPFTTKWNRDHHLSQVHQLKGMSVASCPIGANISVEVYHHRCCSGADERKFYPTRDGTDGDHIGIGAGTFY